MPWTPNYCNCGKPINDDDEQCSLCADLEEWGEDQEPEPYPFFDDLYDRTNEPSDDNEPINSEWYENTYGPFPYDEPVNSEWYDDYR